MSAFLSENLLFQIALYNESWKQKSQDPIIHFICHAKLFIKPQCGIKHFLSTLYVGKYFININS